jgi:hypothetical protein
MGSPLMSASAIVPGPAFVMMVSTAAIHSCTLSTKPTATTWLPPGQTVDRRVLSSFLLRPQITATCGARRDRTGGNMLGRLLHAAVAAAPCASKQMKAATML